MNFINLEHDIYDENPAKKSQEEDKRNALLYNLEDVGNDIDYPDQDLLVLINTTNSKKKDETDIFAENPRKSQISNKYNPADPIQEENIFDYIKPKKNSFLLFFERNGIFGKTSYNVAERKSLFKNLEKDSNINNQQDTSQPETLVEIFKKRGRSLNIKMLKKANDKAKEKEETTNKG